MKTIRRTINSAKQQRTGAMLPMIAVTLVILIIGVVFSIDIAYMHMVRAELRTATDAAARAGAESLARAQDPEAAIDAALQVAALNSVSGDVLQLRRDQVVLGSVQQVNGKLDFNPNVAPFTAVRVVGDRGAGSLQGSVPLFFGRFLGQDSFQPTQVATASASVRDISLVLDISGSMGRVEGGISRLDALKAAVRGFIAEIESTSPNSTLSLTAYSTTSSRVNPLTRDFRSIENEVDNFNPRGRTNIRQGLRDGSDSLVEDNLTRAFADKTIVLMTDGNFNEGGTPVPSARLASRRGHQIHTITFSSGANQRIMRTVADIGGGDHIHADDAGDLTEAFRSIARSLSVLLVE